MEQETADDAVIATRRIEEFDDTKLSRCPYCGGPSHMRLVLSEPKSYRPTCNNRWCLGWVDSLCYTEVETAIRAWNKRVCGKSAKADGQSEWKAEPHGDGICWNLISPEGVKQVIGDSPWFSHGERAAAKYLSYKASAPVVVYTVNERDEERGDDRILDVFWTREKAEQFVKERQTPCWVEEHYRDAF